MGCEIKVTVTQAASGGDLPITDATVSWYNANGMLQQISVDSGGSATVTLTDQTQTLISVSAPHFEGVGKMGVCNVPLLFELTEQASSAGSGSGSSSPKGPVPTDPTDIGVVVNGYSVEVSWKAGANSTFFQIYLVYDASSGSIKENYAVPGGGVAQVGQSFSQTFTLSPGRWQWEITGGNSDGEFSPGAFSVSFDVFRTPVASGSAVTCLYEDTGPSYSGGTNGPGSRVYYLDSQSHVNEAAWSGDSAEEWLFTDTGAVAHGGSALTSLYISGDGSRIYYLDANGYIQELAWTGSWKSTGTGALAHEGSALTCFYAGSNGSRVYYLEGNNYINELAWTGSGWQVTATGGAAQSGSALTCLSAGSNGSRVYYLNAKNHVTELAWTGSGWQVTDTGAVAHSGSALTCLYTDSTGSRVYYLDTQGYLKELAWTGSSWQITDTGAVPHSGTALTCFYIDGTGSRVYALTVSNTIGELAWTGSGWKWTDLG